MREPFLYAAAFVLLMSVTGCTASVGANTTGCTRDNTVSCFSGGTGYQCGGSDSPSNSGQVCSTNGTGEWCCYASTSCNRDTSVAGCVSNTYGYSCTRGQPPPDATDSSLICSIPTAINGLDEYCCASSTAVSGATCSLDQTVANCQAGSYGFSCTGSDRPESDYSGVTCSAGTAGGSATLYCCVYNSANTGPVVTCNPTYQEPAGGAVCGSTCDACLQTYDCGTQYKACDATCQGEIEAMKTCMKNAADANGGSLPSSAETTCSASSLGGANSAAYALWWQVISVSLDCSVPCCAVI